MLYVSLCLLDLNMKNYVLGNWRAINILTHPCNDLPLCRFLSMMMMMTMTMTMMMMMMTEVTQHIPTMTKSHHGGEMSVMIKVGICQ